MFSNLDIDLNLKKSIRNEDGTGILLVDKPTGMTSHDVVAIARKKLNIKRIGHAGTLDPLATGLLILLVGRQYTKLQDLYLKQDKEYLCTAQLGVSTDTFDSDGNVTSTADWQQLSAITEQQVKAVLDQFIGEIEQTVPSFSAVKIKGQKLYSLARKSAREGEDFLKDITLPVRKVTIYSLTLEEFSKNDQQQQLSITFRVLVSSGTYIRSLANDMGKLLGVGASVTSLRRTKIGQSDVINALQIEQI